MKSFDVPLCPSPLKGEGQGEGETNDGDIQKKTLIDNQKEICVKI
jgi:hypothetical protein